MNSPFVIEQAGAIVKRAEISAASEAAERIKRLYAIMFGRQPTNDEITTGVQFVAADNNANANWQRYAQALMVSNEFVFID
jgi:hypothetical protein